jgi:PKD repeat protein
MPLLNAVNNRRSASADVIISTAKPEPTTFSPELNSFMKHNTLINRLALAGCALLAATQLGRAQIAATLTDIGPTTPVPGANDQSQLLFRTGTGNPDGLNYYWDNGSPPGSTFTTGGNAGGYVLNTLALKTLGGGGSPANQPYILRIYSLSGSGNTSASLIATFRSQSFAVDTVATAGDWLQMSGLNFALLGNTTYAYTFARGGSSGYVNLGNTNGNPYAGGIACAIPTAGGTVQYTTTVTYDAAFDIGLNLPSGLTVNPPTSSAASPVSQGTTVVLSSGNVVGNVGAVTYQWQTDGGGNGGVLTNIPGATASTYTVFTTNSPLGNIQFQVVATDSSSATVTSSPLLLNVIRYVSGTFTDLGTNTPAPGAFDASQLTTAGTYINSGGINYYTDGNPPPGQTFTTGSNAKGYSLNSLAIQLVGGGSSGTTTPQGYDLFIYSISADGTTAALIADVTNLTASFVYPAWVQWTFPAISLNSNAVYAYTFHRRTTGYAGISTSPGGDAYPGGQVAAIPTGGGTVTYGNNAGLDGTFDVGLIPNGVPFLLTVPTASPNPAYALSPVKLFCKPTTAGIFTYQWLTDDGSGSVPPNYIPIAGATATNLTVVPGDVNPGGGDYTTNYYLAAKDTTSGNSVTSSVVTLTVHAATAPQITGPTPTALVTFVGNSQTYSVTEIGTLPITNQWQFSNGGAFANLTGQTNTSLTLTNLQTTNSGTYQVAATNLVGNAVSPVTLTVLPAPPGPNAATQKYFNQVFTNQPWAYWRLNETNDPTASGAPTFRAYDYSGHNFDPTYGYAVSVKNAGPSAATPGFPGFDAGQLAAGTTAYTASSYLTVPALNLAGNTNITFIAWINPNGGQANSAGLLMNRGGPDSACGFGFTSTTDELGYTWNNNNANTYSWHSGLLVAENNWNFVAYVITPTNATVYLGNLANGATNFLQAVNSVPHTGETFAGGTIRLGGDAQTDNRTFGGLITEATLFTNALSTAQIQQYFLTAIGATVLPPTVTAATASPSANVYSGQNVLLVANASGSAPLSLQWQISTDNNTFTNIPGANSSTYLINPTNIIGSVYYQLVASNSAAVNRSSSVGVTFNALPSYPPGLWTANFQETNNIAAGQNIGAGVGRYVGRGIVGNGMAWNVLPHVLASGGGYAAGTITSLTDFLDDGVTHSGIICQMNNGGSYNSLGGSLPNSTDIGNILEQYYRTYFSDAANGNGALQFRNVPNGYYNLVLYAGNGKSSNGANNYGSTFVAFGANGRQTNSTFETTYNGPALVEGANFCTITNVHIVGGVLNVDVQGNAAANGAAIIEAAQIQLVSYDPPVAAFTAAPTNAFLNQTVTFTNTTAGNVTNAVWNFGDGTPNVTNSSNANVTHSYAAPGTYTVSLVVSGAGGGPSTVTKTGYIVVSQALKFASVKLSGTSLVVSGSNGPVGVQYRILSTTNLALPLASWSVIYTNVVAPDGSYGYTNASPTGSGSFFRLVSP